MKLEKEVYWNVQDIKLDINEMTLGEAEFFSPVIGYEQNEKTQHVKVITPDNIKFFELHNFIGKRTRVTIEIIE